MIFPNCLDSMIQVVQRFQELFSQTKYKEAAELAAESPQGLLRTPETVAKFQVSAHPNCTLYMLYGTYLCSSLLLLYEPWIPTCAIVGTDTGHDAFSRC